MSAKRRIERGLKTVQAMIAIHCRGRHGSREKLCGECDALLQYARQRVENCRFGVDKPVCAHCPVHCFKPEMRLRIRDVMRYAGPRMMRRHPVLTIFHLIESRRQAPKSKSGSRFNERKMA